MKRRLKVAAFTCAAALAVLTACTNTKTTEPLSQDIQTMVEQQATSTLDAMVSMSDEALSETITQAQDQQDSVIANGLANYQSDKDDLGNFVEVLGVNVEKTEDGYTAIVEAQFEKRVLNLTVGFDKNMTAYTDLTVDPVYTMGEKMTSAAGNLVVGMVTVFAVLIFISFVISQFKHISVLEAKLNKKEPEVQPQLPAEVEPAEEEEVDLADDYELVAVIAAAIAAYEGTSPNGLVVRSIRRRGKKPGWNR